MSNSDVGNIKVKLNLDSAAYEQGIKSAVGSMQALSTALGALTIGLGAAQIGEMISKYKEQEQAERAVASVIKSTGEAAGLTTQQLENMAKGFESVSNYSDEAVLAGQKILLTFTNIKGDTFKDATKAMLDMSTVMGQDLQTTAIQLGKALQDPIKGVTALRRAGVMLSDSQKNQIKQFMKVGEVAQAQEIIISELNREFGDAAKNLIEPTEQLQNRMVDLQETIGSLLKPSVDSAATSLTKLAEESISSIKNFQDWAATNKETINTVRDFGLVIVALSVSIPTLITVVNSLKAAYETLQLQIALGSKESVILANIMDGNLLLAFTQVVDEVKALTFALLANPWTWVVAGLTAAGAAMFAYYEKVQNVGRAIDDLNASQDQNVNKTVEAIKTIKELAGAKNLDYNQTERLDDAISYLTQKYPKYIGRLREELALKGKITQATAEEIANEITLAKVKGLQAQKKEVDKRVSDGVKSYKTSNLMSAARFGTPIDTSNTGRTGAFKADQINQDRINKELSNVAKQRKAIVNDLTGANLDKVTPSAYSVSGVGGTKKKKGKSAKELAAEEKRAAKEALDYKVALLEQEKYKTKLTDDQIYQIDLKEADLKIAAAKKGTSEYAQAVAEKLKLEQDHAEKLNGLRSQQLIDDLEYNKQELDSTNADLELEYEAGRISKVKMLQLEIDNIEKKKQLERDALAEQLKLVQGNTAEEVKLKRASNKEIEDLERDRKDKSNQLQEAQRASFKDFSEDLSQGWGSNVSSLIKGDVEFSEFSTKMFDSVLDSFGDYCGEMVTKWLSSCITIDNISKLSVVKKIGLDKLLRGSDAETAAAKQASNVAEVAGNTAVTASNAATAASNTSVAATGAAVVASNTATAAANTGLAATGVALTATNTGLAVSNAAVATSSATAAGATAVSSGVMTGAAATMGAGITAIVAPVMALAGAFATLALSSAVVAVAMPVIAVATTVTALSAVLAAAGLGLLNAVMLLTAPIALLFAPISVALAAEFAIIAASAELAAIAVGQLAVALAAESAAAIPLVGWAIAPGAAAATGAAITAADAMLQFRENGGPVAAGQAYVVGEKRPELFIPDRSGTILPNTSALNGGNQTVHQYNIAAPISIQAIDTKDFKDKIVEVRDTIHSALYSGIKKRQLKSLST